MAVTSIRVRGDVALRVCVKVWVGSSGCGLLVALTPFSYRVRVR